MSNTSPFVLGHTAFNNGGHISDNPFSDQQCHEEWAQGFESAQAESGAFDA